MKKKILILSNALEMGGIEKSLIGLLLAIDANNYEVDLFLKTHKGEYFGLIPSYVNLLPEVPRYKNIEKSAKQLIKDGNHIFLVLKILSRIWLNILCKLFNVNISDFSLLYFFSSNKYLWRFIFSLFITGKSTYISQKRESIGFNILSLF